MIGGCLDGDLWRRRRTRTLELERLRGFPNSIAPDELIRFFTLTTGDIAFVNGHRTSPNRIGVAVQLRTLP